MATNRGLTAKAAGALILVNLFAAGSAFGNTLAVTNTADSGPGSLRDAIQNASPGDTIDIGVNGTITLSTGPLFIAKDLAIVGPGPLQLAIDGGHSSRVFTVGELTGGNSTPVNVAVSGLTVRNGSSDSGGGIFNGGRLTLTNTIVSGNTALDDGGAIYSGGWSTLNVIRSVVSGNAAGSRGGGIRADFSTLTLVESAVSGNSASLGGGVNASDCAMTLSRSTVSDNSANGEHGFGGGIASAGSYNVSGTLDILDSTISGNFASYQAGGLFQGTGLLTVNNSTFAGNWCSGASSGCTAGGIYNQVAVIRIANSTFAANVSPVGGNITSMFGTTTLKNSIVAKGSSGANCHFYASRAMASEGHNLSDDASCSPVLTAASDRNDVAAGLSSDGLQDNGGPTRTIQLLATSPALDAVPLEACTDPQGAALISDQRGVTRPQGAACDIGAFEQVPTPYVATVVPPIKADGTSVFSANRGVVPVKFTLTDNGAPTCQLPAATVSLARTAGAVIGPVTESDYLLAADAGVTFRVDTTSCEYVYNLGSSSLGAGTYAVSISIGGALVGTATFAIR